MLRSVHCLETHLTPLAGHTDHKGHGVPEEELIWWSQFCRNLGPVLSPHLSRTQDTPKHRIWNQKPDMICDYGQTRSSQKEPPLLAFFISRTRVNTSHLPSGKLKKKKDSEWRLFHSPLSFTLLLLGSLN